VSTKGPADDRPGRDSAPGLAVALKVRVLLYLGCGCSLRAGEVVRLKGKHIDRAQKIIRTEQSSALPCPSLPSDPKSKMGNKRSGAANPFTYVR